MGGHKLVTACTSQNLCLLSHVKGVLLVFMLVLILHCLETVISLLWGALKALAEYLEIHLLL